MEESMEKFDGTYTVDLGTRRLIATQDPGFIDYVLRTNHKIIISRPSRPKSFGRFLGKGLLTVNGDYWLKTTKAYSTRFSPW